MAEPAAPLNEPIELSPKEFDRLLEARIQRDLGLSLDEFVALMKAGKLPDTSVAMGFAILLRERSR
jgi:hypothetical protein